MPKKDAFANIGGWLALNDGNIAEKIENLLILSEGFPTYGGLSGRDLDIIAQGLKEIVKEDYLKHRIDSVNYLAEGLIAHGVPVIQPTGGHAIFIDAKKMLPHIEALQYPAHSLAVALYLESGIRGVEIGSLMFAKQPCGSEVPARRELLRLAVPRRVYTQSHFDYTIEAFGKLVKMKDELKGYKIDWEAQHLRHFTAKLSPHTP